MINVSTTVICTAFKKADLAKSLQKDLRALFIATQKHNTMKSQSLTDNYAVSFLLLCFKKRTDRF